MKRTIFFLICSILILSGCSGSDDSGVHTIVTASDSTETNVEIEDTTVQTTAIVIEDAKDDATDDILSSSTIADTSDNKLDDVEEMIGSMTLDQKIAQLFIITPEALTGVSTVTAAGPATKKALSQYPVGGVIYFKDNIVSPDQLTTMASNMMEYSLQTTNIPIFISIDEEGGSVARIASNSNFDVKKYNNMASIGASGDTDNAREVGDTIGAYLSEYNINLDFAPDADVLSNPDNEVIGTRSFGSDPQLVSEMVIAETEGLESHQVHACIKHFPGHGATLGDSHKGFAYTDKTLEELTDCEFVPFQKSIENGVDCIMVSHIAIPTVTGNDDPSTLSKQVVTDILRGQLGYQGLIITDALDMGAITETQTSADAAVKAIEAGCDMLLMPEDFHSAYEGVKAAVQDGRITQERLDESVRRILKVKYKWL